MEGTPHHEGSSLNAAIFMCHQTVNLQMRAKNYEIPEPSYGFVPEAVSSSHLGGPLHIENPHFEALLHSPKGILRCMMHNPNTRASHNYSIVEDLVQAPCSISALEVLQSCPMQWKDLLYAIGGFYTSESSLMTFDSSQVNYRIFQQVSFQIIVLLLGKNFYQKVVVEGASTCIMYISCWKALVSAKLNTFETLLKEFYGHMFQPHGIIIALIIELGGNTVSIDVKVVNAPLEYNLLLDLTWF
jgi:hypothetical protein